MDAFLQRRLFTKDVCILLRGDGQLSRGGEDEAAELRTLLRAHGGNLIDPESVASDADADADANAVQSGDERVNVVLVADNERDEDMLKRLVNGRFPCAQALEAQWVRDCVAKNRRLPTSAYALFTAPTSRPASTTAADGASEETQPPAKKLKRTTDFFAAAAAATTRAELPHAHLTPWRTLHDGSLYVLDARAPQSDDKPQFGRRKIAGFDLDGTLIVTKSGKRFAQDARDWKWFHPTRVCERLRELVADGYTLVIFSNQNGVAKGNVGVDELHSKVEAIVEKLDLPVLVFLATQNDAMRKPRVGVWSEMLKLLDAGDTVSEENVDRQKSLYCGDAAGRPKIAGRSKDFAATDYKFALNLGIPFRTPEDLFLDSKQRIHTRPDTWELGFDPRSVTVGEAAKVTKSEQELVVLVGPPASGKSFFAKTRFDSYVVVNQDELRTLANCKKACLEALAQKRSVVVDSTNRDPRTRKEWLAIAKQQNLPIRCFEMDVPKPLAMHLNVFRSLTDGKKIPDVAIHGFYKNMVSPTAAEGFAEIAKVRFQIDAAKTSKADQDLLRSYL